MAEGWKGLEDAVKPLALIRTNLQEIEHINMKTHRSLFTHPVSSDELHRDRNTSLDGARPHFQVGFCCIHIKAINFQRPKSFARDTIHHPPCVIQPMHSFARTRESGDGLGQMFLSRLALLYVRLLHPNLSLEESHGDERFTEWASLILRSCQDWM